MEAIERKLLFKDQKQSKVLLTRSQKKYTRNGRDLNHGKDERKQPHKKKRLKRSKLFSIAKRTTDLYEILKRTQKLKIDISIYKSRRSNDIEIW